MKYNLYSNILQKIDEEFGHWESANSKGNRSALRSAIASYQTSMSGVWGPHAAVHPRTMRRNHESAREAAWEELRSDTAAEDGCKEQDLLFEVYFSYLT